SLARGPSCFRAAAAAPRTLGCVAFRAFTHSLTDFSPLPGFGSPAACTIRRTVRACARTATGALTGERAAPCERGVSGVVGPRDDWGEPCRRESAERLVPRGQ